MPKGPDELINKADKGDETLKRYAYQIYYAVQVSLTILDEENEIEEVFCEQIEDILVKKSTGKFIGVQVKTKDLDLGPFKSDEESIVKSIQRFTELDTLFPDLFEKFILATNTGFIQKSNQTNLNILIDLAKSCNETELTKSRSTGKKIINSITKKLKCNVTDVVNAISKIEVHSKYATLDRIDIFVKDILNKIPFTKNLNLGKQDALVEKLFLLHFKASSLSEESNLVDNYLNNKPAQENSTKQILKGKKIDKSRLLEIINKEKESPISLFLKDSKGIGLIPKSDNIVEIKMDAGKISSESIALMKDLKYSAEEYMAGLIYKVGADEADERYNQVRLIVNNECQEVYDELSQGENEFGIAMLTEVRKRLGTMAKEDKDAVFDSRKEHLLGMSAVLTEECLLWWSEKFEIND